VVTRLSSKPTPIVPVVEVRELRTESDVEQKVILPFLLNASYLGLRSAWIRTKEYMSPTEIDKTAGKRYGYIPDYSVWVSAIPLTIVEAKAPDVAIQVALREARLYAGEINKRYPPEVNPIGHVLACNGVEFGLSAWDSEVGTIIALCSDVQPGTQVLNDIQQAIGRDALEARAKRLAVHFQTRAFFNVASFMGGQSRLSQQLGVNEFAEPLFSTITKYFGSNSDETPDEVIDRAYVSSDEIGTYEGVLETYLKDRTAQIAGNQLKPITTTKTSASGISSEVQRFSQSPASNAKVQLIIGSVGAGKSTFIRRFYRRLMAEEVAKKTRWAFLNFNVMPPGLDTLRTWVTEQFIESFAAVNNTDIYEADQIEKIFAPEVHRFERGPAKALYSSDRTEYVRRRTALLDELTKDPVKLTQGIARHFSGDMSLGIVIVFDNVDKRSRDQQLAIFEAAQWFKELTKSLVLVNLRDSTFEAHREEPPLDAFINAINFYIRPPRFAQVIRKRLELVLENLQSEVTERQVYSLASGYKIQYPPTKLGAFLMSIYLSLFDDRSVKVAAALEALVAKDVRRALSMFGDIIVSPHIPTTQITSAVLGGEQRIQEYRIIRALMRGRYKYYNGRSLYIYNVLYAHPESNRPSNLLIPDILDYLIRNRKSRIDFTQEGYATIGTIIKKMSQLGYDDEDVSRAIYTIVRWGLIEPESLTTDLLTEHDAVRMHASGFIHMRFFLERSEYLLGLTTNMQFASREIASEIGQLWASQDHLPDLQLHVKVKIMTMMRDHIKFEYGRRCRRHPFYEEHGLGGRFTVESIERAAYHLEAMLRPARTGIARAPRRTTLGYRSPDRPKT
jgi:GTPase SAR1 family protein